MVSDVMFSGAMFVLNVSIACLVPALLMIGLKSVMLFLVMLNFLANSAFVRCVSMMPLLKECQTTRTQDDSDPKFLGRLGPKPFRTQDESDPNLFGPKTNRTHADGRYTGDIINA